MKRIVAGFAGGALLGVVFAVLGGLFGGWLGQGNANGWADLIGAVLGTFAGYSLGAPLGVIGSAALLHQAGVRWRAFAGSFTGGVITLLLAEPTGINQQSWLLMSVFGGLVLLGAFVGYYGLWRGRNRLVGPTGTP